MATNTNLDGTSASADPSSLSDLADLSALRAAAAGAITLPSALNAAQLSELAFMTGVDPTTGTLTADNGWTWDGDNPPTYGEAGSDVPHKWDGGTIGSPGGTVYYAFNSHWTTADENIFNAALTLWSDYANIHFVQVAAAASPDLLITPNYEGDASTSDNDSGGATAGGTTLDVTNSATVSIDTQEHAWSNLDSFTTAGGYGVETVVHELGHVLGLMHTGPYNGSVNPATQQYGPYDSRLWSVMSYIDPWDTSAEYYSSYPVQGANWGTSKDGSPNEATTPQMLDILAAQELYGVSTSTTFAGGQVFGFDCNITDASKPFFDFTQNTTPVITIWDSGANNTLDLSGFTAAATVNLNPGSFSSVDGLTDNIGIAYNTYIDDVIGGSGNNSFTVNDQSDTITGGGGGGNTVIFAGPESSYTLANNAGTVTVADGSTVDLLTDVQTLEFSNTSVAASSISCFAAGTRIATRRGPVAVQTLRVGDDVKLARGGTAPVRWLGHRTCSCARHPRPWDVLPVRVRADAFGAGVPAADLVLSPDHAVFIDGVLIPIRYLLNGATVVQEAAQRVTYWHVELPAHDVLLAEGLACESYLDTGNRGAFANGGAAVMAHPDFARRTWRAEGCAPLLLEGPAVQVVRCRLLAQAMMLGHRVTTETGLALWVDGVLVQPRRVGENWRFALPQRARFGCLLSRTCVPAHMHPASSDCRVLGVAVGSLALDGENVELNSPRLRKGWHAPEDGLRWTDGPANLDLSGARELELRLAWTARYWADAPLPASRQRAA
jgi:serralysin